MNADEADALRRRYIADRTQASPGSPPETWLAKPVAVTTLASGGWVFLQSVQGFNGAHNFDSVVVRNDGRAFGVYGSIGNLYVGTQADRSLGGPLSEERWLGSGPGRYQLFDRGIIVWEGAPDQPYCVPIEQQDREGRHCHLIVAFYDLRDSTGLANDPARAREVQGFMAALEASLQDALARTPVRDTELKGPEHHRDPFIKGTGDGAMIAIEWSEQPAMVAKFFEMCVTFMSKAKHQLASELALGCGIDCGPATQVFAFGRRDYLGSTINNAFKLQHGRRGIWVSANAHRQIVSANPTLALGLKASEQHYHYEPPERSD